MSVGAGFPGDGSRTWRPSTGLLVALSALGAASIAATFLPREPLDRAVTGLVGGVLLGLAIVLWRRRLTAGPRGLLIDGPTRTRIVPWSMVRAIDCGRTKRMGSATLEIDLVDDELILLGRFELGTDPAEVAEVLAHWFDARPRTDAG